MDRLKFFQIVVIFVAAIVILRLFYWQFINRVESNQGPSQDSIPAQRGEIFTSDNFPLVTNQKEFIAPAKPAQTKDPKKLAEILAHHLISEKYATDEAGLSDDDKKQKEEEIKKKQEELAKRLDTKTLSWVQLARKLPPFF